MTPALHTVAVLLLAASTALAQKESAKKAAPLPPPPKAMNKGGFAKGTPKQPGAGAKVPNPAHQFERLLAMTPDERERVIEKLPPQQQERLRARLDQFDHLPPAQKAWRLELANRYFALPPERQQAYTEQVQSFNKLEPRRRRAIGEELRSLWAMPDTERQARLNNDAYKSRFSSDELKILNTIGVVNVVK